MRAFTVPLEDDEGRPSLLVLEAPDAGEAARRARYLLEPTSGRLTGPARPSSVTPAMVRRLGGPE